MSKSQPYAYTIVILTSAYYKHFHAEDISLFKGK